MRKTVIILLPIILLIFGCEQESENEDSEPTINFTIQPNLEIDNEGYYHLTIDRNNWGTTHRVSGFVSSDNGNPVEFYWVEWDSNLYWYIGDTLGYVINEYLTDTGLYVTVDTSYIIGFNGMEVPTTNTVSYSNSSGEINNMIRPVKSMIGDTLVLRYYNWELNDSISIVLD